MNIIKRIMAVVLITFIVFIALSILAVALPEKTPVPEIEPKTEVPEKTAAFEKEKIVLDQILVNWVAQDIYGDKQKVVVSISNTSTYTFSATLYVVFREKWTDKLVGYDYIYVENLAPGGNTFAIVWIKPNDNVNMRGQWSRVTY